MAILEVRNLKKTYGDLVAVADVSFSVEPGEVFGLLGPNGAGKSTTMMAVCGLLRPDSGAIRLNGEELTPGNRELKKLLGVVPQDLAIYPELTARQNLEFFGKLYGLSGKALDDRVADALERTGLAGRADDASGHFSGGMKRRLNFGCALLHGPKLLILDEPTVGIDPQSRNHLLESVKGLAADGMAVIYASHYMEEVQEVCRRVAIVDHGKLVAEDSLDALLGRLKSCVKLHMRGPRVTVPERYRGFVTVERDGLDDAVVEIDRGKLDAGTSLDETLETLLPHLRKEGATLMSIETEEPNLERLFLQLTGSRLRD